MKQCLPFIQKAPMTIMIFQGRGYQKFRLPANPSTLTVATSTHLENTVGAQQIFACLFFCCSILNNHLYSSWPTQITSSDLFPLANWLNSTLEVEINLFSHCYGLQQALFTPLVSSSSSRWIWNGFLCKQGCVTERNVQTYQESCRVAVNLRGGRQPPPD